jgi:hypothetical protein
MTFEVAPDAEHPEIQNDGCGTTVDDFGSSANSPVRSTDNLSA